MTTDTLANGGSNARERTLAAAAMIGAAACWGLATVMTKSALSQFPPFSLLALQLTASVTFLWLAALVTRRRALASARTAISKGMLASGLLEPGLAYGLGVPGLALTSASSASLIATAEPAFICIIAWLALAQRPGTAVVVAIFAAMAGVGLITLPSAGGETASHFSGDVLVLAGTLFAACYVVASSRYVADIDPVILAAAQQSVGLMLAIAMLAGALMAGAEQLPPFPHLSLLLLVIASGIVQYALAFWLYLTGLKSLPPSIAGMFLTLIPVFGVGGAMLFLGESLTALQWIGCAIIIAAVLTLKIKPA